MLFIAKTYNPEEIKAAVMNTNLNSLEIFCNSLSAV